MKIITINIQNGTPLFFQNNRSKEVRIMLEEFFENDLQLLKEVMRTEITPMEWFETDNIKIVTVNIPSKTRKQLKELTDKRYFPSRSEIIRFITVYKMMEQLKEEKQKERNKEGYKEAVLDEITIIKKLEEDPNGHLQQKKESKPWKHVKPERKLNIFPRDINQDLFVSYLYEYGKMCYSEFYDLFNTDIGTYMIAKQINKKIPNLVTITKTNNGRNNSKTYYSLNLEKLNEILEVE